MPPHRPPFLCPLLCPEQDSLTKVLLFGNLDSAARRKVVREMYERRIAAGEILIQEGDTGWRTRRHHALCMRLTVGGAGDCPGAARRAC